MFKQEIIDKKFSRAFQGYDIAEVDYFLDELYRELSFRDREEAALQEQIRELREELEALHAQKLLDGAEEEREEESTELYFLEEHIEEEDTGEQDGRYGAETEKAAEETADEARHSQQ